VKKFSTLLYGCALVNHYNALIAILTEGILNKLINSILMFVRPGMGFSAIQLTKYNFVGHGWCGMKKVSILFCCMGNICRSPTAEAVFRARVDEAGLAQLVIIDSVGTHDYHIGDPPDLRTQRAAMHRGYDMSGLRGRQVEVADFTRFDYVLAMDNANMTMLQRLCPQPQHGRLGLFLEYASRHQETEVPDPYYGGGDGFERVLDMVEDAAEGLLSHIKKQHLSCT
jgi:protein-tyrosine phosphatase